ncbi:RING-H2 finger protein ATL47-like isoform X2 [Vicia villosa]|uniref:RING-H2 finger protein ATL47-like isoform X2 n=1 Tax=Vicia villosa TaxID=3911 RepID=UPI00273C008A|nr:RING-H2 finger protein ATL47-like isoform X2 [Vicia villosa]
MAGRLPGVGLSPRKKSEQHHNRHENYSNYRDSYLRKSLDLDAPWTSITTTLDENAFKAKQRLEKKLGSFFSSSRSSEQNPRKEEESRSRIQKKDTGLGRKLLESAWLLRGNRFKKERNVCAVCLEDFHQNEEVMNLSCSHKYHSACLLPWLERHPHCPYCRTVIEPKD